MNTYGDIGNQVAGWYSRKLLSHALPVIVLENLALTKELPKKQTKIIEFRRSRPFAAATTPLVEGEAPESSDFGYDAVSVQMQQYGDYAEIHRPGGRLLQGRRARGYRRAPGGADRRNP